MVYKILDVKNIGDLRKEIAKLKNLEDLEITVIAGDDVFNRQAVEIKGIGVLLFRDFYGRDKLKQRDSGLNQVICKIAREKGIKIGFDFLFIENSKIVDKEKADIFSRISQNFRLCRKFNNNVRFFGKDNFNEVEIKSLLLNLGASTKMIKDSFV